MLITGQKGKSGGGGAKESPNTLQSSAVVTLVEALGEGPIEGLVDGLKSVYIDGTPIQNFDGTMNRQGVSVDWRIGEEDQAPFLGNNRTGTPVSVESQVKFGVPVVRTITEYADQVQVNIRIPALAEQDTESGELRGASLSWLIQRRASGGSWETVKSIAISNQKCTSPYNHVTLIDRPSGTDPFDIQVVRGTPDSTVVTLQNDLFWESYVALVKGRYIYPATALVQLRIDSKLFGSSLGERSYRVKGLKTEVPTNYNPITRTYTGIWDGTFVTKWHNNPAWVFWDLITNNRYGLGEFVDVTMVDKWSLYQIARYCDELVPSGFKDADDAGITEPRFTFNGVINSRQEAYKVLQDISAAFRGMAYWSLGQVFCSADMPADPVSVITPANVIDGRFNYSGTSMKARHTVAMISWNDPNDNFKPAIEVVQNPPMLARFGWRQVEIQLVGCTSRGQAHRYGRWVLDTEQHETETVQFTMSWDGYVLENNQALKPGDIILVSDPRKNGSYRAGGRLVANSATEVVLDFPFDPDGKTYNLSVMLPSGKLEKVPVASFAVDNKTLTLGTALSEVPQVNADWILESSDLNARRYRVMAVEETDTHQFKVTALFNDPTKYNRVEQSVSLEPIQYVRPRDIIRQPTNVTSVESHYFQNGVSHSRLTLSWTAPNDFTVEAYNVTADTPRGFVAFPAVSFPSMDVDDPVAGNWTFYISARSHTGTASIPTSYTVAVTGWQAVSGPIPDNLHTLEGAETFTGRAPTLVWENVFPANSVIYPVTNIVRVYDTVSDELLRAIRVTSPSYTYSYEDNINDGGPRRSLRIDITALNVTGIEGPIASITVSNPTPAKVVPTLNADVGSIDVQWINPDNDYAGAMVWASKNIDFVQTLANSVYDGPDTKTTVWVGNGKWYIWVGLYDAFGKQGMIISDPQSLDVSDLNSTIAQVIPDLVAALGTVTQRDLENINEDVSDQIAGILTQIIADRDDADELHKRSYQKLSVETANLRAIAAEETTARIEADFAEATRRRILEVKVNEEITAAIAEEQVARASADEALTSQINTAMSQIGDNTALITTESETRATADTALASQYTTLSSTVGEQSANLTVLGTSIDGVKVQFGVIGTINGTTGGFLFTGIQKLDGSVAYNVEINGGLIVTGTISANKLNVNSLSAITANIGTVTAGLVRSANNLVRFDLDNASLIVADG